MERLLCLVCGEHPALPGHYRNNFTGDTLGPVCEVCYRCPIWPPEVRFSSRAESVECDGECGICHACRHAAGTFRPTGTGTGSTIGPICGPCHRHYVLREGVGA